MEVLQTLSIALGLAALSGLSLYLTVFTTGMAIHFGWLHLASQYSSLSVLGEPPILIISGVLFALEFFADKIPWVDSIWDAVHTVIRPIGGAFLAIRVLGDTSPVFDVIVALLGGTMSFASHSVKASTRLIVNSSPEPFSNIAVSSAENAIVIGGVALLWHYPVWVFASIVVLLAIAFYFLPRIWRSISMRIWFISRKLNHKPGQPLDALPNRLPGRYDLGLRKLTGLDFNVAWAVPCVSGRGKFLEPNRFGYLVASCEQVAKVYFITRKFFGGASKLLEIEDFNVSLERRMLFEELNLYSPGKNRRFTFRFDRGNADLATKVAEDLQRQLTATKPIAIATRSVSHDETHAQ
jgi:Domain of unknown function (DUF4126)